jgi:allophanate hydrolase
VFGDAESEYLYDRALEKLATLGTFVEIDSPRCKEAALLLYGGPWVAERTAAIAGLLAAIPRPSIPPCARWSNPGWARARSSCSTASIAWRNSSAMPTSCGTGRHFAFPTTGTAYRVAELAAPIALNSNLGPTPISSTCWTWPRWPCRRRARQCHRLWHYLIGPADSDRALLDLADAYLRWPIFPPPPLDLEGKMQTVKLAVVGAHLKDMPLHWQLTSRNATFVEATTTAPAYRLYAIADSVPPKPALIHAERWRGDRGGSL